MKQIIRTYDKEFVKDTIISTVGMLKEEIDKICDKYNNDENSDEIAIFKVEERTIYIYKARKIKQPYIQKQDREHECIELLKTITCEHLRDILFLEWDKYVETRLNMQCDHLEKFEYELIREVLKK